MNLINLNGPNIKELHCIINIGLNEGMKKCIKNEDILNDINVAAAEPNAPHFGIHKKFSKIFTKHPKIFLITANF